MRSVISFAVAAIQLFTSVTRSAVTEKSYLSVKRSSLSHANSVYTYLCIRIYVYVSMVVAVRKKFSDCF
jgi:hypothetical protein